MTILHDKKNGMDTEVSYLSTASNRSELINTEEKLASIRLVDVDLGTGKKYVFVLITLCTVW